MTAFSLLYLYVHYPTDVLAGTLLGIMLGWFGNILVSFTREKLHDLAFGKMDEKKVR